MSMYTFISLVVIHFCTFILGGLKYLTINSRSKLGCSLSIPDTKHLSYL